MEGYKSKVDLIYDILQENISSGKYKSGERLVIRAIAKENGVSEIPVREAIRRLEIEGWITTIDNKGPSVTEFSKAKMQEIFEIKAVLEGYASRLACDQLSESDFAELEQINDQLSQAMEKNVGHLCSELNKEFHLRMYRDIKEQELNEMIQNLWSKYRLTMKIFSVVPGRAADSVQEHKKILALVREKKYDEVEHFVREHKMRSGQGLVEKM